MNRKKILEHLQYFIAGFILIITGIQNVQSYAFVGYINILIGVFLLVSIILLRITRTPFDYLKPILYSVEGIGFLMAMYLYLLKDTQFLHYMFLLAAIGNFISAYVFTKRLGKAFK